MPSPDPRNPRNCRRHSLVYDWRTARHLRGAFWMAYPALPCHLSGRSFPPSVRRYLGRRSPIPFPTIICFIKVEPYFVRVRLSGTGFPTSRYASPICTRILPDLTPQVVALTLSNRFRVVVRAAEKCTCGKSLTFAHKRARAPPPSLPPLMLSSHPERKTSGGFVDNDDDDLRSARTVRRPALSAGRRGRPLSPALL